MSKSYTPKYVVQTTYNKLDANRGWIKAKTDSMEWKRSYGRPTEANLKKFIDSYNASLNVGGSNEHLAAAYGYIPYANGGSIRCNTAGGAEIVSVSIPFMVI